MFLFILYYIDIIVFKFIEALLLYMRLEELMEIGTSMDTL